MKDKYKILYDFTYMWNLKKQDKWTNITKQKQSHRYREQTAGCQGVGGEDEWNRLGKLRGTYFQLQNKWVTGMKCSVGNVVNNNISLNGGKGGQKVQTSSYKINKYWGCNVQYDEYN